MKTVLDFNFLNKTALIRVDFNVPLDSNQKVLDNTRISSGRIAHSYLLFGATGVGKLSVAIKFAERIICSKLNKNELEIISAQQKINGLTHPDLHFVYPVNTSSKVKSKATSKHFLKEWRESIKENPYITLSQWLEKML